MKPKINKRVISFILILLLLVSVINSTTTITYASVDSCDYLFGDVNGDGTIDFINDVVMVNNYINGNTSFTEEQKVIADVNGDSLIDNDDVQLINSVRQTGDFFSLPIYNQLIEAGYCGKNGDNIKYYLKDNGTLVVFGEGEMWNYYSNTSEPPWHKNNTKQQIKSIMIKDGVTNIGGESFYACGNLTNITIPDSVITIGAEAFRDCTSLSEISIPNTVNTIGNGAFKNCSSITKLVIPSGITRIQDETFYNCSSLSSISIPDSITSVSYSAFQGTAWYNNQSDGLVYLGSVLYDYKGTLPANTSIDIKSGTKVIASGTFNAQKNLKSIVIPSSVQYIGDFAFANTGLTSITIPNNVTSIGHSLFRGCSDLEQVTLSNNLSKIFTLTFYQCESLKSIVIPQKITLIEGGAFKSCQALTSVTIPNNVTNIGNGAFEGSPNVTIFANNDSYAHTYANNNSIPFESLDEKSLVSISISKQPNKTIYSIGEALDTTGLQLKLNYDDGSISYVTSGYTTSGFSATSAGTKTVTVTYQSKTTTFTVTINPQESNAKIIADSVTADPGDTVDVEISLLDNPGIVAATIKVNFDSSTLTLTKVTDAGVLGAQSHKPEYTSPYTLAWANDTATTNYNVNGKIATLTFKVSNNAVRGQTYPITISYNYNNYEIYDKDLNPVQFGITNGSIAISQTKVLSSVSVSKQPSKTTYFVGESLDTTGLQLKLTYSDGSTSYATSNYTTSGFSSTIAGTKTITVTYQGKTTTFNVTVKDLALTSISVSKQPTKTTYSVGETLDTTGLQLKLNYDDGSTSYASSNYTTSGFSSASAGTKTVTVTYGGKTTTFTVTVNAVSNAKISAESVTAEPGNTVDVKISLSNNPGIVAATIKVNYNSSVLTLTKVTDAGVLGAQSHKPEYTSPYTLAWANDTATTNYTVNGTIATLTFKVSNNAVKGQSYPIELSYNYNNYEIYDKDLNPIQFYITNGSVAISQEKTITSISVSKQPTKTTYFVGEALDTNGLQLNLNYDDGSITTATSGFTTSGFSSASAGTKTVTVTYQGKTTTFTVTVKNKSLTSISVSKLPTKTTYFVGEALDTTGLQLRLTYDDGSTSTVSSGFTTSGFSSTSAGTKSVTVTYSGKTTVFTVTVNNKSLTSISVSKRPTKTTYFVGEVLDTTGLQLKLTYDDGSTSTVSSGFTTSGFSSTSAGTKTITVTYSGKTASFDVTVKNKSLTSISVSKQPTKTTYFVGEALDTTGLQLKLIYDDGSTSTATSGFTTSGFSSASAGTKIVTVTYQGKTATYNVTVKSSSVAMITAENVTADPGDTVDIKIGLSNNPGIVSATIKLDFDSNVLTLTKVTDAGVLGAQSHKPEYTSPYTLAWANDTATTNYTVNGTIVTLTFKVSNDAVKGQSYPISLSYNYNNYEIYDKDLNPVQFGVDNGSITVAKSSTTKLLGDVDGDGQVTIIDATMIQRHLAQLPVISFDSEAADTDGDGDITIVDATFIQRWLANIPTPYKIGDPII